MDSKEESRHGEIKFSCLYFATRDAKVGVC